MIYEPIGEKGAIAPMPVWNMPIQPNYRENYQVKRTRTRLLIVLAIELILDFLNFVKHSVRVKKFFEIPEEYRDSQLGASGLYETFNDSLTMIYVVIFLIFTIKYVRLGIRICAWLGIIQFFLSTFLSIVHHIQTSKSDGSNLAVVAVIAAIFVIGIETLSSIIWLLIVYFGFQLSKLLKIYASQSQPFV